MEHSKTEHQKRIERTNVGQPPKGSAGDHGDDARRAHALSQRAHATRISSCEMFILVTFIALPSLNSNLLGSFINFFFII
jgi:hypothetical protein